MGHPALNCETPLPCSTFYIMYSLLYSNHNYTLNLLFTFVILLPEDFEMQTFL